MKEYDLRGEIIRAKLEIINAEVELKPMLFAHYLEKFNTVRSDSEEKTKQALAIVTYTGDPTTALLFLRELSRDLLDKLFPRRLYKEKKAYFNYVCDQAELLEKRRGENLVYVVAEVAHKGISDGGFLILKYRN